MTTTIADALQAAGWPATAGEARRTRWVWASVLWTAVVAWLRGLEPVLVYGPHGRAKMVPRAIAERLAKAGRVRVARSVDDARGKLGLPSIGIDADPDAIADTVDDSFAGIERGVAPPLPEQRPLTVASLQDAVRGIMGATPEGPPTWTCEVCRVVHPIDHEGMILHACGGMICCSCETRWPEHQAACEECRAFAEGRGTWAPPAPFDLSDVED